MTILPIKKPYRNLDETTIQDNLWLLSNCYLDEANAIRKMPGLLSWATAGTSLPIDGLYWWDAKRVLIVVSGGNVYSISDISGSMTTIGTSVLAIGTRVVFSEIYDITNSELRLFMANGGAIKYTNGSTVSTVAGGLAPTRCTHVASLDTYLICNDLDSPYTWKASTVEDPTNITQSYAAQAQTDSISAIFVADKRIYVAGRRSIEPFYNSSDTVPFRSIGGAIVSPGIINPYAYVVYQNMPFIFTSDNDFGVIEGYRFRPLSISYAKRIQELPYLNDVSLDVMAGIGGRKWIMLHLADADLTLAYDLNSQCFSERSTWNGTEDKLWNANNYAFCGDWNFHVVGDRYSGIVYKLSEEYTTDDGTAIHCEIITGNYSHGTLKQSKYSDCLDFNLKRGVGKTSNPAEAPKLYMQVRDNFQKAWSQQFEIDLGSQGETWCVNSLNGMGSYKTRQYRFVFMDDAPLVINSIEETLRGK